MLFSQFDDYVNIDFISTFLCFSISINFYHFPEENSDFCQRFHTSNGPGQIVTVSVQSLGRTVDGGDLRFA